MRTLQTFARRPFALLALGTALVASVPACACGFGFVLVPFVGAELLRIALDAAQSRRDPVSPAAPPASRSGAVGLWLALPLLAAMGAGGLCAALEATVGRSLVARAASPFPALVALTALVVTAALASPIALAACAAATGARDALSAIEIVHARRGLRFSRRVVASCAALPPLLTAPWSAVFAGGSWTLTAVLASLAALAAPLAFCAVASAWTVADAPAEPAPTTPDALPSPSTSRFDRVALIALGVLVLAASAGGLAASLTPARLTQVPRDEAPLDGPLRTFETTFTLPGTTVRIAREGDAVGVSVADGGGAGQLPGLDRARSYRVAPRPELCPNCVELELRGERVTTRTLLDAAGVRHDDGTAARLASAGGLTGNLALVFAVVGTLALAQRARRPRAASLAVLAGWCAAALAFAHGVLA